MIYIENIIRAIVREELERALGLPRSDDPGLAGAQDLAVEETRLVLDVAAVTAITGMSKQYVRNDIRDKHLAASRLHGKKFVIERDEATRYAEWLVNGRP